MDWRLLPVAPLYAHVRAYCSHVNMYSKRVGLLSSHPRLFIHSLCLLHPTPPPPSPLPITHCFHFLLGIAVRTRETENNTCAKGFGGSCSFTSGPLELILQWDTPIRLHCFTTEYISFHYRTVTFRPYYLFFRPDAEIQFLQHIRQSVMMWIVKALWCYYSILGPTIWHSNRLVFTLGFLFQFSVFHNTLYWCHLQNKHNN